MNRFETFPEAEAEVDFGDGDFIVLLPGAYVRCAVTGEQIPLEELRYWSVEKNEAYRDASVALARWKQLKEAGDLP